MCGGRDRFFVHKDRRRCQCRKCGFLGDAIDLLVAANGLTVPEAMRVLTGRMSVEIKRVEGSSQRPDSDWHCGMPEWQKAAAEELRKAQELLASPFGIKAVDYLSDRGLVPGICKEFGLGYKSRVFDPQVNGDRPAVVIPWIIGRTIKAIKYRFIDDRARKDKKYRFIQMRGSDPILFGSNCQENHGLVLGFEGEFNAIAAKMALPNAMSLSFGSESSGSGVRALRAISRGSALLTWFDDAEHADRARAILGDGTSSGGGVVNPGGVGFVSGFDCNEMLARFGVDYLRSFLVYHIEESGVQVDASLLER